MSAQPEPKPMSERVLHVAALPFPSHQGTQAAIRRMLEASTAAGRDVHLLTYAAAGHAFTPSFPLHRVPDFPRVSSLRAGPSVAKLALDARMFSSLRTLERRLRPDLIVAHHVEAAALALALRRVPVLFFAHTDLGAELPTYGPKLAHELLRHAGQLFDRSLLLGARAVATISPALRERFATQLPEHADKLAYVPTPWPLAAPISKGERARSRQLLGLDAHASVALYAGNLDAYQGIDTLLLAVRDAAQKYPTLALLIATESDAQGLRAAAARLGLGARLHVTQLLGDEARRRVHAAADVAVVPRLAPGGLPIKLLDALGRGVACAVSPRAAAGLPLTGAVSLAQDESAAALGIAIEGLLSSPTLREELAERGRDYIAEQHAPTQYLEALDALIMRSLRA